jgi:hypothetical protein
LRITAAQSRGGLTLSTVQTQMSSPTRNLLIVQDSRIQDPTDWIEIRHRIERLAPDIEVRIANNHHPNSATARWQVKRPSVVFSPGLLVGFSPRGGAVFSGQVMGKDEQLRRLTSIGLSTPRTAILSSTSLLEPKEWGEYVIVKPNNSNGGKGVKLVRTIDLSPRYEELVGFADDRFLVQQFIDHSEDGYPTAYRVLTLFGRALYCTSHRWGTRRPPLAEIAANPLGEIASNTKRMGGRVHAICNDTDIIALGERAHQAFPECPLLGVDVIRERQNGHLLVLEVNPHGAVWHFSSPLAKTFLPDHVRERYAQFKALDRAADLLIEKTRASAC